MHRRGAFRLTVAGAMVPEGREYPPRSLIVGVPAKRIREVTEEQMEDIARGARSYVERAAEHRKSLERRRLAGPGALEAAFKASNAQHS